MNWEKRGKNWEHTPRERQREKELRKGYIALTWAAWIIALFFRCLQIFLSHAFHFHLFSFSSSRLTTASLVKEYSSASSFIQGWQQWWHHLCECVTTEPREHIHQTEGYPKSFAFFYHRLFFLASSTRVNYEQFRAISVKFLFFLFFIVFFLPMVSTSYRLVSLFYRPWWPMCM